MYIKLKKTPIACLAIFRVFVERTIKDAGKLMFTDNKKAEKFRKYSLRKKGKAVAEELQKSGYIDKGILDVVLDYSGDRGLFTFNNIQSQMHSKESYPSHSRMNNYWDELDPFLAACWRYIKD